MTSLSSTPVSANPGNKPAGRALRVLYADDMKELRDLMRIILAREGHTLETCSNGEVASLHVRQAPAEFDLLITDHHMPVMDGLELVRKIRETPYAGKIIVFSSELNPAVKDEYEALHVDRVLAKPIRPNELRQVLVEMFPAA